MWALVVWSVVLAVQVVVPDTGTAPASLVDVEFQELSAYASQLEEENARLRAAVGMFPPWKRGVEVSAGSRPEIRLEINRGATCGYSVRECAATGRRPCQHGREYEGERGTRYMLYCGCCGKGEDPADFVEGYRVQERRKFEARQAEREQEQRAAEEARYRNAGLNKFALERLQADKPETPEVVEVPMQISGKATISFGLAGRPNPYKQLFDDIQAFGASRHIDFRPDFQIKAGWGPEQSTINLSHMTPRALGVVAGALVTGRRFNGAPRELRYVTTDGGTVLPFADIEASDMPLHAIFAVVDGSNPGAFEGRLMKLHFE